jgi:arabinogalactan endo-1,4-beta-galactosidase
MKKFANIFLALLSGIILLACSDNDNPKNGDEGGNNTPTDTIDNLVRGADISWLSQMEASGYKFYYPDGREGDCIQILEEQGITTFRFRLWVNPENGYSSTEDVLQMAKRVRSLGGEVMLDFHYSDNWADPSSQTIPTAWEGKDLNQLAEAVKDYTTSTLQLFSEAGIVPKYIQIGNETGNGMLWPYGKADINPEGYTLLNNSGYDAAKSIFPDAKVIVHLQNGQDNSLYRWLFDILKKYGGRWDVIGMSLYPEPSNYASYVEDCKKNMQDMISRYVKDVLLCEVGMGNSYVKECKAFLEQCFELSTESALGDSFLGLLYWEPQVYNDWQGYKKGAFTNLGRPSAALEAFKWTP